LVDRVTSNEDVRCRTHQLKARWRPSQRRSKSKTRLQQVRGETPCSLSTMWSIPQSLRTSAPLTSMRPNSDDMEVC